MKSIIIALALIASGTHTMAEPFAKGRVLLLPKVGVSEELLEREVGGKAKRIGQSNLRILQLPDQASERAVVARLSRNPQIEFAELDREVPPSLVPNDPYYSSAWHLQKIGAPLAWDTAQGSGVTIAILDSGVDPAHPDLYTKLVPGWNFYDSNSNTSDVYGHGTKTAGAAAAITGNAIGVSGIAGAAKIMPIRVTATTGSG